MKAGIYKLLKRERDTAIYSGMNAAHKLWREEARATVEIYARMRKPFTTDEVLTVLEKKNVLTRDNRALGGIMLKAEREGITKRIGARPTTRRCAHLRYKTLWIGA